MKNALLRLGAVAHETDASPAAVPSPTQTRRTRGKAIRRQNTVRAEGWVLKPEVSRNRRAFVWRAPKLAEAADRTALVGKRIRVDGQGEGTVPPPQHGL